MTHGSLSATDATAEGALMSDLQAELDRLEREDPAVAKASKGLDAVYGNLGAGLSQAELKAIYDPPEPRYLGTLSDGDGDLG